MGFAKPYSDKTAEVIDAETAAIIAEQMERAKKILQENAEGHNKLAEMLLEYEVITSEDVESVLGPRPWKSREDEIIKANEALNAESDETKKKHSPRKKTAKTDTSHETTEDIELEVEIEEPIETTETAATTEAATETTESQEKES
jgi:cell division protease FtsH